MLPEQRAVKIFLQKDPAFLGTLKVSMEGIEPSSMDFQSTALPLSYIKGTRINVNLTKKKRNIEKKTKEEKYLA